MQPLTNKNVVGWTFSKLINMMNENLFKNIETDELINIKCIGGNCKIHKSMLMYFNYFNNSFNKWKVETIKLEYKVECVEYLKKMLYHLEYIQLLDEISAIELLELLDYINSPNIFINRVVKDMVDTYDNNSLCNFIKSIRIRLPKKSKIMLFKEIMNDDCNDKYINTLVKYLPEFTNKIIEYKISQLNYVEIRIENKNKQYNYVGFNIDDIPHSYKKNIIHFKYIKKFISDSGEYDYLFVYFNNNDNCIHYYNYHIKKLNMYRICMSIPN